MPILNKIGLNVAIFTFWDDTVQLLQQKGDDGDGDSGSQPEHPVAHIFRLETICRGDSAFQKSCYSF